MTYPVFYRCLMLATVPLLLAGCAASAYHHDWRRCVICFCFAVANACIFY